MASTSSKSSDAKRKSSSGSANSANKLIVKLKCSPERLIAALNGSAPATTSTTTPDLITANATPANATPANATPVQASPAPSTVAAILPPLAPSSAVDLVTDSNPATPGTGAMAPPEKKKGTKRAVPPDAKPRAKPGPKKKQRLEEGIEIKGGSGQRLGPKASMGAINAGLRALDRSGTPCRKWAKGGFKVKTFTGVVWEVNRWKAPTRSAAPSEPPSSQAASVSSSNKENKEGDESSTTANGVGSVSGNGASGDVEMLDAPQPDSIQSTPMPIAT